MALLAAGGLQECQTLLSELWFICWHMRGLQAREQQKQHFRLQLGTLIVKRCCLE